MVTGQVADQAASPQSGEVGFAATA